MLASLTLESGALMQSLLHMERIIELGEEIDFSLLSSKTGEISAQSRDLLVSQLTILAKKFPTDKSIVIAMTQLLAQNNKFEEALEQLATFNKIIPHTPRVVLLKAEILNRMNNPKTALRTLRDGTKKFRDDIPMRLNYARMLVRQNEFKSAIAEFETLLKQDPDNHGAGPKVVEIGDVVVVDLGARVNDWVSDITRTYSVGPTTNETIIEVYMAVYDAQNLTFPLIEAGTPAWALDDIARTHIEEQGYGDYFIHSLGHGYGVCVHEPPLLSSGTDDPLFGLSYNQQPLAVWDAITIEPGIYLDGWFGVRIEDDFLVNQESHEFLSADLPRDLDWFMIKADDYSQSDLGSTDGSDSSDASETLPFPIGMVQTMMLLTIVASAFVRNENEE